VDLEVDNYLADTARKLRSTTDANDPLQWWYNHRTQYPRLYPAACRALTAAATSVKSEQVWSQGARIHTGDRQRMQLATLAKLLVLQQECTAADVQGLSREDFTRYSRRVLQAART